MSPFLTSVPSLSITVIFIVGSTLCSTFSAMSTPASIPSSFIMSRERPMASAGIVESVVWSPSPRSSANARLRRSSISSSVVFIFRFYMFINLSAVTNNIWFTDKHGWSMPVLFVVIWFATENGHCPVDLLSKEKPHHFMVKRHF